MRTEKEIFDYSYRISGLITSRFSIYEYFINAIIGNYYCKDVSKIDDFIFMIQYMGIDKRIEFLEPIIMNIIPEAYNNVYEFKFLKANGVVVTKFKNAIYSIKELRNQFSHYTAKMPTKEEMEQGLVFTLEKFEPRDKSGNIIFEATKHVLTFDETDEDKLVNDMKIMQVLFYNIYNVARVGRK